MAKIVKEETKVWQGKVKKVGCYPLKKPEPNPFKEGTMNTHRLSIELEEGLYVGFGMTDQDAFYMKDPTDSEWKVLGAGSELVVVYKVKTTEDGGTFIDGKRNDATVVNFVEGKVYGADKKTSSTNTSNNSSTPNNEPYDLKGVLKGHGIKCAVALLSRFKTGDLVVYGKEAMEASKQLKEELVAGGLAGGAAGL